MTRSQNHAINVRARSKTGNQPIPGGVHFSVVLNGRRVMAWRSGQSYAADLREGVLAAVDGGLPATAVAERFGVSLSFIDKVLKPRRLTGETAARAQRNQQELKLAAYHETIQAEIVRRPDVTLDSLRAWLVETHGVEASLGLMHNTLIQLGLYAKKSRTGSLAGPWGPRSPTAAEQDRPDVTEQRATWRAEQAAMSRGRLIFIDETGGIDQDGPALRPLAARPAPRRGFATWPLDDSDLHRRPAGLRSDP